MSLRQLAATTFSRNMSVPVTSVADHLNFSIPGPGSKNSGSRTGSASKNLSIFNPKNKVFCLLLFEGTFASFFSDKKPHRRHKTVPVSVEIKIYNMGWSIKLQHKRPVS
jgi:hypothetical protein